MALDRISESNHEGVRYTRVAIWLHWTIATLILYNLALGFFMEDIAPPMRLPVVLSHMSAGITVLALSLVRILWRLRHPPPALSAHLRPWERFLAHLVHGGFYVGMLVVPLLGWAMVSANPPPESETARLQAQEHELAVQAGHQGPPPRISRPIPVWGIVPLPAIAPISEIGSSPSGVARQERLHDDLLEAHAIGSIIMICLLLLHFAGAVKHQFIDGSRQFRRMGIGTFDR